MEQTDEWDLISKIQKGDIGAFEILMNQYENQIFSLCIRMLNDEHEAYDAAQEICIKIWRQIQSFEGKSRLSTWIYRIATNQCIDIIRKKKRKKEVSFLHYRKEEGQDKELEVEDIYQNVEHILESKELSMIMEKAILELKPEYRIVSILRDINNYSYEEIASILGISIGTVKSRISRARNCLKKILSQNKEPYISYFRQINKKEGTQNEM